MSETAGNHHESHSGQERRLSQQQCSACDVIAP
jgi:hypothetical protein